MTYINKSIFFYNLNLMSNVGNDITNEYISCLD